MDFYERVKFLVKSQNLSLLNFLKDLGINYETYKSAKRLNVLPRADEAIKIASSLGTTVEFLVTGKSSAGLSDEQQNVILKFSYLDESNKNVVITLLNALYEDKAKTSEKKFG